MSDNSPPARRTWPPFVILAFVWPLAVELLLLVSGFAVAAIASLLASRAFSLRISSILTPFLCAGLAWWAGSLVRRAGGSRRLWVVPAAWAVGVAGPAVAIFGFSDVRDPFGLFGVLGSFVLGAAAFGMGVSREVPPGEDGQGESRI